MQQIIDGVYGGGDFSTTTFKVSPLSQAEMERTLRHIDLSDGLLTYNSGADR